MTCLNARQAVTIGDEWRVYLVLKEGGALSLRCLVLMEHAGQLKRTGNDRPPTIRRRKVSLLVDLPRSIYFPLYPLS